MKVFSKSRLATCIISAMPMMGMAADTSKLEKLESETTDIAVETPKQEDDASRIYLDQGAIWASRDITRFDPVLDVSVSDELEVEEGTLRDSLVSPLPLTTATTSKNTNLKFIVWATLVCPSRLLF